MVCCALIQEIDACSFGLDRKQYHKLVCIYFMALLAPDIKKHLDCMRGVLTSHSV